MRSTALLTCVLALAISSCVLRPFDCADEPNNRFCKHDGDMDGGAQLDGDAGPRPADASPCGECTGTTPICRESDMTCVGCLDDGDCNGTAPFCDPATGVCVTCLGDSDCNDPSAARCGPSGTCVACTDSTQCDGIVGRGVCASGMCVECSDADTRACGGNACTVTNTCSDYPTGMQEDCQPCDTDANCEADHYCVPMQFMGADRSDGYCLKNAMAEGGCNEEPFTFPIPESPKDAPRTSLSGASGMTFCGIVEDLTTCEAVLALLDDRSCIADSGCPLGGRCEVVGYTPGKCTYACQAPSQCPGVSPADRCDGGSRDAPSYCGHID